MIGEIVVQAIALLLFPGAASVLVFGLVVEGGARALLGAPPESRFLLGPVRGGLRRMAPTTAVMVLLLSLGATQLPVPLNPVPAGEHTLFIALGALAGAGWFLWLLAGGDPVGGRVLLLAQVVWVVAVLTPALAAGSLLPAQVNVATLPFQIAARAAGAVAYLAALPVLLHLHTREAGFSPGGQIGRLASWGPQTGLFASLVLPALRPNAAGVLLFALICVGASAVAVVAAVPLRRRPDLLLRAYPRLLVVVGVIALGLGIVAIYLP